MAWPSKCMCCLLPECATYPTHLGLTDHMHMLIYDDEDDCLYSYEGVSRFLDWPPGARTAMIQLSATRCSCIAIL